jgi:hypothetical protein
MAVRPGPAVRALWTAVASAARHRFRAQRTTGVGHSRNRRPCQSALVAPLQPAHSKTRRSRTRHFGLRWQAQRDTAFARTTRVGHSRNRCPCPSAVAAPLCRRTPKHVARARDILDCGGKRSATPLSRAPPALDIPETVVRAKAPRRSALPAHSKTHRSRTRHFGLRWQAQRDTAFARTTRVGHSRNRCPCQSASSLRSGRRTPKHVARAQHVLGGQSLANIYAPRIV